MMFSKSEAVTIWLLSEAATCQFCFCPPPSGVMLSQLGVSLAPRIFGWNLFWNPCACFSTSHSLLLLQLKAVRSKQQQDDPPGSTPWRVSKTGCYTCPVHFTLDGSKSYCLLSNPHFYAHSKLPAVVSVTTLGGLLANLPVSIVSFTELSASLNCPLLDSPFSHLI